MALTGTQQAPTEEKSVYEMLRDARVAELAEICKPIEKAATEL
jgi:hypothetical protein